MDDYGVDDNSAWDMATALVDAPDPKVRAAARELRQMLSNDPDTEARDRRRDRLAARLYRYWNR